jgi:FtsP/CotA-like multicopper oxidase with cupredoxin domain
MAPTVLSRREETVKVERRLREEAAFTRSAEGLHSFFIASPDGHPAMTEPEKKLNVVPGLAAAALLLAVAALAAAVVAVVRANDSRSSASATTEQTSMPAMGGHAMDHMAALPIGGIADPPADQGNTALRGVERNGALEFTLDARPVWWRIFGHQRLSAYAYNGIVPGPQIRVRNGQRVRIKFTNRLPVQTTIHWHGIGVPNSQDGVPGITQKAIPPGGQYTYEFVARPAGGADGSDSGGTFLYHSHVDEDRQMPAGLYGSFIIDPRRATARYAVDRTLVISEWTADAASGRTRGSMQMEGMFPNFFTINGKSYPDTRPIDVPAGKPVLLRLINAGQFAHPLHLHGTAFRVVARDGHPTGDRSLRDTITLESGERADIAFTEPPGKWIFHCHIGHHLTNDGAGPGGLIALVRSS